MAKPPIDPNEYYWQQTTALQKRLKADSIAVFAMYNNESLSAEDYQPQLQALVEFFGKANLLEAISEL